MTDNRKRRVKLEDIALASGVSLTAVSLALSNKPGISKVTRERVLEIARTLGYRFKIPGNSAPDQMVKTIGLVVKSGGDFPASSNSSVQKVYAGIETACHQLGINLIIAELPGDEVSHPIEFLSFFVRGEVDGLLMLGLQIDQRFHDVLDRIGLPVVLVDSYCDSALYSGVFADYSGGAYLAVNSLISSGHQNIGYIRTGNPAYRKSGECLSGYIQAVTDHGLTPVWLDTHSHQDAPVQTVMGFFETNPEITSIIGETTSTAVAAVNSLLAVGLRKPEDITLVGFDDTPADETTIIRLSTVQYGRQGMGRLAVHLLLNQANQASGGCVTSMFSPILLDNHTNFLEPENGSANGRKML
jgi:DNA-binding LacI/PurR family transcriptional regulator